MNTKNIALRREKKKGRIHFDQPRKEITDGEDPNNRIRRHNLLLRTTTASNLRKSSLQHSYNCCRDLKQFA